MSKPDNVPTMPNAAPPAPMRSQLGGDCPLQARAADVARSQPANAPQVDPRAPPTSARVHRRRRREEGITQRAHEGAPIELGLGQWAAAEKHLATFTRL
jgi:hypothetical protein